MSYDFSKAVQGAHFRSYGEGTEVRLTREREIRKSASRTHSSWN